ncbi:MAG: CmcI family methyltransferase [Pirellulaceae bacterium]
MASNRIQDDTHSDYHAVKKTAEEAMNRGVWESRFDPRFEKFLAREMRCELSRDSIDAMSRGKNFMHYRGIPMAKDPLDKVIYEMLFFEIQPKTIIELGAYTGASALWMADAMSTYGVDTQIISVDIDLSLVDARAKNGGRIEFREGDCNRIEALFPAEELKSLEHPLILVDDAHVNLPQVYEYFHKEVFETGDYLIVEDTNPHIPGTFGDSADEVMDWGDWKHKEIKSFFNEHDAEYQVDRYYTDFFGYNATWNWNGFIRRM